jgi:hypothetical protein
MAYLDQRPPVAVGHHVVAVDGTERRHAVDHPVFAVACAGGDPQTARARIDRQVVRHFAAATEQDLDEVAEPEAFREGHQRCEERGGRVEDGGRDHAPRRRGTLAGERQRRAE